MADLPPMSWFEQKLRKLALFFWSPIVFIPTRIAVAIVFFVDFTELASKWALLLPFLLGDLVMGGLEMYRRTPRWLQQACAKAKAKFAIWDSNLQITADRTERIFDEPNDGAH